MELVNGTLYWGTRFTVTQQTMGADTTFSQTSSWSRPGEMLTHDGALYWVDQTGGFIVTNLPVINRGFPLGAYDRQSR